MQCAASQLGLEPRASERSAGVCHLLGCRKLLVCWTLSVLMQQKLPEDLGANVSRGPVPWLTLLPPQHPKVVVWAALVRRDCQRCRNWGILGLFNDG